MRVPTSEKFGRDRILKWSCEFFREASYSADLGLMRRILFLHFLYLLSSLMSIVRFFSESEEIQWILVLPFSCLKDFFISCKAA